MSRSAPFCRSLSLVLSRPTRGYCVHSVIDSGSFRVVLWTVTSRNCGDELKKSETAPTRNNHNIIMSKAIR